MSEPLPESRYRLGERTTETRKAKARADRERRRAQAAAALPPDKRQAILRALSQGTRLAQAAREAGTTTQAVHGLAKYDPAWGTALDAAQRAAAPADCPHGTPTGYRWYRCQCAACRAAKDGHRPAIQTTGAGRPTSERLRAELDATAVRLGCADLEDLIRQTRHLTIAELGRLIGRSQGAAAYWRHKILDAPQASAETRRQPIRLQKAAWEQRRAQLAEAAGFTSWEEAITRTAHMRPRHAARELGADPSGIVYWRDRLSREYAPSPSGADSGSGIPPKLDAMAVSHGYSGLEDLIRSTAALPRPQVARMLECKGDTVTRWRRKFGVQAAPAARRISLTATEAGTYEEIREAKARAAGYPCWREAITATVSLSLSEAARRLEVETATILQWRRKFRDQGAGPP
ncbi:hypothetical protein [Streptosporangium sp. NPDC004631]